MRKLFSILGAAALVLAASYAATQVVYTGTFKEPVYSSVSAVDTDVALVIRYVGANATGTVTVESDGNLTFKQGAADAADTTLECPVDGALGGIIDVSDGDCDTVGEVLDIINASADWKVFALDAVRTDSSNDTFLAAAQAEAQGSAGLNILFDSSVALFHSRALVTCRTFACMAPAGYLTPVEQPYLGTYSVLVSVTETATYASGGTSTVSVLSVKPKQAPRTGYGPPAETVTTLWSEAGGATATAKTIGASAWPSGLIGVKDTKLIYRVTNSSELSAVTSSAYGLTFSY